MPFENVKTASFQVEVEKCLWPRPSKPPIDPAQSFGVSMKKKMSPKDHSNLVGGATPLKNMSQNGNLPQVEVRIQNI